MNFKSNVLKFHLNPRLKSFCLLNVRDRVKILIIERYFIISVLLKIFISLFEESYLNVRWPMNYFHL